MIDADTFLQDLKTQTRPFHDVTEKVAASNEMRNGTLSLVTYQNLLTCNFYIHQHLEKAFSKSLTTLPNSILHAFIDEKSEWLKKDLALANIPINHEGFRHLKAPQYDSLAAIIGGLYVVEGSMLGGQYIVKLLKKNTALNKLPSFHFYRGYEHQTGKRWKQFQSIATSMLEKQSEFQIAIEKAKETFIFFQAVYKVGIS